MGIKLKHTLNKMYRTYEERGEVESTLRHGTTEKFNKS